MLEHAKKLLNIVPALAALAVPVYILFFGVNVPFWDEWSFVDTIRAFDNNTLSVRDLFSQHLEHRLLFPRVVMLVAAKATSWNVKAEMFISWLISCTGFVVAWQMLKRAGISDKATLALVSILYFNVGQWENILWGWQISVYLMVVSVLCVFYFLSFSGIPGLLAAAAAGVVASFSFMNGMLVWPLGLVYVYLSRPAPGGLKKTFRFMFWALAGGLVVSFYFYGYTKPEVHPDVLAFLHSPSTFLLFFSTVQGSMLGARSSALSALVGLALLMVFFIFAYIHYNRKSLQGLLAWVMLGLFSMASALSISAGRMGFGLKQAMPTKYTTITMFLAIADIVLVASALARGYLDDHHVLRRNFTAASLTVLLAGAASFYGYGILWGHKQHDLREQAVRLVLNYRHAPDSELEALYPAASYVRESAGYLEENRLSVFK